MAMAVKARRVEFRWVVGFTNGSAPPNISPPDGWEWYQDEDNIWLPFGWSPNGTPALNLPSIVWRRMAMREAPEAEQEPGDVSA